MAMLLMQLTYVSSVRQEMDEKMLEEMLLQSNRNNLRDSVTGMLLYAGGCFIQVLEGEQADVYALFARIKADPRHRDIFLIDCSAIELRSFPRWSMGFRKLQSSDAMLHPAYARFSHGRFDASEFGAHPGLGLELLMQFGAAQRD